LAEFSKKL